MNETRIPVNSVEWAIKSPIIDTLHMSVCCPSRKLFQKKRLGFLKPSNFGSLRFNNQERVVKLDSSNILFCRRALRKRFVLLDISFLN